MDLAVYVDVTGVSALPDVPKETSKRLSPKSVSVLNTQKQRWLRVLLFLKDKVITLEPIYYIFCEKLILGRGN